MSDSRKLPNTGENKMGVMSVGKLLLTMALPMVVSMLVQAMYNVVDSIYVSQISESAVTALGLAFPVQNMQIGFATGIGVGMNALLSKSLGEGDQERVNKAAGNGIFLMLPQRNFGIHTRKGNMLPVVFTRTGRIEAFIVK